MRAVRLTTSLVAAALIVSVAPAYAQTAPPEPPRAESSSGAGQFIRDVGSDYKNFFSWETALWLGIGGAAAAAIHPFDDDLKDDSQSSDVNLKGGQYYGGAAVQVPLAVGWWIIGAAAGSTKGANAGRDLLRAQISATSWTYAIKYPVNRTRPNGDPRSFPSGHASSTFATAAVLQQYYGWKLGIPAYAAAAYTAASRVTDNKHWASDVTFGAFLGIASGRTVTLHVRRQPVAIAPSIARGGGTVFITVGGLQ